MLSAVLLQIYFIGIKQYTAIVVALPSIVIRLVVSPAGVSFGWRGLNPKLALS